MERDGRATFIERGGFPLGMFRDARYYEYYLPIEPGQILVLYTDGATEASNPADEEYGRERLAQVVRAERHRSARSLIDAIYADVLHFTEGRGADDDITLIVIKAEEN
jgi:sigma-B regulation protein RsbU (phosphoserine phosphatase)